MFLFKRSSFSCIWCIRQLYIPICFYLNKQRQKTINHIMITLHSNMFLFKPFIASTRSSRSITLHSNMFLFKQNSGNRSGYVCGLYIPICFYLNYFREIACETVALLYIPICFYLNHTKTTMEMPERIFTFQYVSI